MRPLAGLSAALLLTAFAAAAGAQDDEPAPQPVLPDESGALEPDDESGIAEPQPVEPAIEAEAPAPATPAPADDPAPSEADTAPPSSPARPPPARAASRSQEPEPAVVVRHVRDDDDDDDGDDEEPAPPGGDPYDIIWIELFGGASYVDLRAISATNFYPVEFVRLAGWGPAGGAAVGFRIEFVSVGVRAAFAHYDVSDTLAPDARFDVGTLAAEVKLELPIGPVRPFLRAGFGFAWHGDSNVEEAWMNMAPPMDIQTTVFGWVFQGALGLDVYLTEWLAIGGAFSIEILNMNRSRWDEEPNDPTSVMFTEDGDAVGVQGRAQGAISFHF